jgi:hypothetical protein
MTRERRLHIRTLALAALAILLAGYTYLVEVRGGARAEREREAVTHLLPFPSEAAIELEIVRPGETIRCQKVQGHWRITAPIQADADEMTITRLLEDVAQAKIERRLQTPTGDLAAYGLAHPVRLTVASADAHTTLALGKSNPTQEFVFVQQMGESGTSPVLLVEQRLLTATQKTLYDLRDKTVLDFEPDSVQGITFTRGGERIRLERRPAAPEETQAGWELREPLRARADRGKVERMLDVLANVRAETFASEDQQHLERYGLAAPWGRVCFDLQDGRSDTLLFGKKVESGGLTRYCACRPGVGPVVTINANLPQDAQEPPSNWRERHVVDFTRADVAELRLISPHQTVVCVQQEGTNGTEWRLAEYAGVVAEGMNLGAAARMPSALRADNDRVDDLLAHLSTLEVSGFLADAASGAARYGLTIPVLKVVALDKQEHTLASIAFGASQGTDVYAASPHLGGVFRVRAADEARFRVHAEDLAAR